MMHERNENKKMTTWLIISIWVEAPGYDWFSASKMVKQIVILIDTDLEWKSVYDDWQRLATFANPVPPFLITFHTDSR